MADYQSALTGTQMDQALLDMAEHNSEAYAVGERNGIAVASDDATYHNNARYYAQIASSQIVGDASSAVRWDTDQSEALTDAQKAQARENINAASDSDVVKITAQTLTSAQQSQARANIMAGGSNRNLLDNPWFTVNQRGFTSNTNLNNVPAVDRWKINNGSGTQSITSDGFKIDLSATTSYCSFQQAFGSDELAGKTVTISVCSNGTIYSTTATIPARTTATQTAMSYTYTSGQLVRLFVMPTSSAYSYLLQFFMTGVVATIRAVKLELGSVSTLANDVPPEYDKELDHCKWYFERIKALSGNYAPMGFGYAASATAATIFVPMHAKRGSGYTVSTSGSFRLVYGQTTYTVTAISKYSSVSNNWLVLTVTSSGMTAGQPLEFGARGDSAVYIDVNNNL